MHTQSAEEDCERRKVVKDFCFPDGIEVKQLDLHNANSHHYA